MNTELSNFAARLCELISNRQSAIGNRQFNELALELFALQFHNNPAYRKICDVRKLTPQFVDHWTQIPFVPTAAFKELELTSIPPVERTAVFHSSGTTEQKPSRHFHNAESMVVYETSLWKAFELRFGAAGDLVFLTPTKELAPNSSLIHMFETVRRKCRLTSSTFTGSIAANGSWLVDFDMVLRKFNVAVAASTPLTLLGTAFSFVHLLDHLAENRLDFHLPTGSRVMETGGYKNRSRTMPKAELHALIMGRFGVPRENILCEYGMSELSSQAYDSENDSPSAIPHPRAFHFPPWARVQIISPETGQEVADGENGLIRIFDLANVFSVAAIQTEDLGVRRGGGFELIGRAQLAESRGCSLMTA